MNSADDIEEIRIEYPVLAMGKEHPSSMDSQAFVRLIFTLHCIPCLAPCSWDKKMDFEIALVYQCTVQGTSGCFYRVVADNEDSVPFSHQQP
jgi:hypothetical protein